ncbi:MAG: hypothetical protein HONBIEJF_01698 [Fimbriimonadaceae bacterium]|nr:hypothetical protein [Fimbriimonadaceae bacterium]
MVMAIILILTAMSFPLISKGRGVAARHQAINSLKNVNSAFSMYVADSDERFAPAMYQRQDAALQMWCGAKLPDGQIDAHQTLLASYGRGKVTADPTHQAVAYMGDMSGFGYNWGFLGSDMHHTRDYSAFPNCLNPARQSDVALPSGTIAFATSSYYAAPWARGDGDVKDFGFIDPPAEWKGNPNVDFRHGGGRVVDRQTKTITMTGSAIVLFVDGHAGTMRYAEMKDDHFNPRPADDSPACSLGEPCSD